MLIKVYPRMPTRTAMWLVLLAVTSPNIWAGPAEPCDSTAKLKTVPIATPHTPPDWALWQRYLLDQIHPAAMEFVQKYTRPDGTLIWRDEWPGFDGSDDGYESFYNFPLYYVLGGPEAIQPLSRHLWEGITRQFTAYGQIWNEFDAHYDWMHHGESYTNFYFFGLADPTAEKDRERAIRFAGYYLNEDPEALNYDPHHKIIRSPITGSRGPRFVNTAEDWVTHRPILADYPLPFDDIPGVTASSDWNDDEKFPLILQALNARMMRGDVPLNLTATSLVLHAYMYTGDPKYKTWIEAYVGAWIDRMRENQGILPDNVGLSGEIGETMDGKWWGGYYGWRWPHGLFNQLESTIIGGANARLVSRDDSYLDLPRSVFRLVEGEGHAEGGKWLVPHRHGDDGWYDFRPLDPKHAIHLWYISRAEEDWTRVVHLTDAAASEAPRYRKGKGDSENPVPWLSFLAGDNPDYPVEILQSTYAEMMRRLQRIREDRTTPDEQDVHHWQRLNPVVLEGLVQLMLGGPNHIYHGGLLHVSVRYFDPRQRRPGIPPDVAALVERITPGGISLRLVNLHPTESRDVIIQGGAFGEHRMTQVRQVVHSPHQFQTIDDKCFQVHLAPGAGGQLEIGLERFANQPSYAFPWHAVEIPVELSGQP